MRRRKKEAEVAERVEKSKSELTNWEGGKGESARTRTRDGTVQPKRFIKFELKIKFKE